MNLSNKLRINESFIGPDNPCFVIAEIGMNHNGDLDLAKAMIKSAAECGTNAVKFQIFKAEKFVTENALVYGEDSHSEPLSQVEMLKKYEFSSDEWKLLKDTAVKKGIIFFASVFDDESLDIAGSLDIELLKIASCDLTNIPLIRQVAGLGRPVLLSTGMSTLSEIDIAVSTFLEKGNDKLILMHCVSSYPAKIEESNIRVIPALRNMFEIPVGFSDHCKENYASFNAVSHGAVVIEKHFTTDSKLPGIDQKMSLNPAGLNELVNGIRSIEKSTGRSVKRILESERPARINGRRSLVASKDLEAGEVISPEMVAVKRPGTGISPIHFDLVLGRKLNKPVKKNEFLSWSIL
jgi:N-acetylneuraminate synthase/N,N'-diacetyllegionaminate synthase